MVLERIYISVLIVRWINCTLHRSIETSEKGWEYETTGTYFKVHEEPTTDHPAHYRPTVKSVNLPRRSAAHYCRYSADWWVFDRNHSCCRLRPWLSSRWHSVFLRWLLRCEIRYRWSDNRWRVLLPARGWPLTTTTSRLLPVKTQYPHFTNPDLVRNSRRVLCSAKPEYVSKIL